MTNTLYYNLIKRVVQARKLGVVSNTYVKVELKMIAWEYGLSFDQMKAVIDQVKKEVNE